MLSLIVQWWPLALVSLVFLSVFIGLLSWRLLYINRGNETEKDQVGLCGCPTRCDQHLYQISEPDD